MTTNPILDMFRLQKKPTTLKSKDAIARAEKQALDCIRGPIERCIEIMRDPRYTTDDERMSNIGYYARSFHTNISVADNLHRKRGIRSLDELLLTDPQLDQQLQMIQPVFLESINHDKRQEQLRRDTHRQHISLAKSLLSTCGLIVEKQPYSEWRSVSSANPLTATVYEISPGKIFRVNCVNNRETWIWLAPWHGGSTSRAVMSLYGGSPAKQALRNRFNNWLRTDSSKNNVAPDQLDILRVHIMALIKEENEILAEVRELMKTEP